MCDQHLADMVRFVVGGLFDVPLPLTTFLSHKVGTRGTFSLGYVCYGLWLATAMTRAYSNELLAMNGKDRLEAMTTGYWLAMIGYVMLFYVQLCEVLYVLLM